MGSKNTNQLLIILLFCIIVVLGYIVVQRERQIALLEKGSVQGNFTLTTITTTTLGSKITSQELLQIAKQDQQVKDFISQGNHSVYLDVLGEKDFQNFPAIYQGLPRQDLFQLNFTRQDRALLVILNPEGVLKVVPVTNLRII